jgi:hypothetical protein
VSAPPRPAVGVIIATAAVVRQRIGLGHLRVVRGARF